MGKKPMKPPMAQKQAAPAVGVPAAEPRGRAGAPSSAASAASVASTPKKEPVTESPASPAPVEVTAICPLFSSCASNIVEVAATTMKKLRIAAGSLCWLQCVSTGVSLPLVCANVTSKDVGPTQVAVNVDTLHLLGGRECTLERHEGAAARELVGSNDSILLHRINEGEEGAAASSGPTVAGAQLAAAFCAVFGGAIVFDRMTTTLTIATHKIRVRVEFCRPDASATERIDFGRVSPLSVVRSSDIAGVQVQDAVDDDTDRATASASLASRANTLIVGAAGMGKTFRLNALTQSLPQSCTLLTVDSHGFRGCGSQTAVNRIRETFALATSLPAAVIAIDNLDVACSGSNGEHDEARFHAMLVSKTIAAALDAAPHVRMFASATDESSLDPSLRKHFAEVRHCEPPASAEERKAILQAMVRRQPGAAASDACLDTLAARTFGFVPSDLAALVSVASTLSFEKTSTFAANDEALLQAQKLIRPSAIRNFEISIPNVRWSDIGGSEEAKRVLQDCVAWSLGRQRTLFQKLGLNPPRGVLLYGPPGCSKTMLAKALACESQLHFISVKGPEVFSKWVGDSEKAVREIFSKARAVAPCVVFIDELDGMCGKRGTGGVSDRVISQFLTELDGLPSAVSGKPDDVVFVAATNRPDNIDAAVLRPGRIDRKVYVGLPVAEERVAIAALGLRGVPVDSDVTASAVAAATDGYTGAEVIAVCKEAALQAIIESEDATVVCGRHLALALEKVVPRVSPQDVEWYKRWGSARDASS